MEDKDIKNRLDKLFFDIIDCTPEQRLDLKRMWKHCQEIWGEVSKEDVECRRLGKNTVKKQELIASLEESLNTLEQYITWAKLLN